MCASVCVCVCVNVYSTYLRQTEGDRPRDHSGVALDREHKLVVGGGLYGHMSVEKTEGTKLKLPAAEDSLTIISKIKIALLLLLSLEVGKNTFKMERAKPFHFYFHPIHLY